MFDAEENLYAAVGSEDPAVNGIVRIAPDGAITHVEGSEVMPFPNAITFDEAGTLYATDSIDGCVWRAYADGPAELWLEHESLMVVCLSPLLLSRKTIPKTRCGHAATSHPHQCCTRNKVLSCTTEAASDA